MYEHTNIRNSIIRESKGTLGGVSVRSEQPDSQLQLSTVHSLGTE